MHRRASTRVTVSAFLEALVAAVPYRIHTALTRNGTQFRFEPRHATVHRYYYDSHEQLTRHLDDCVAAYNFARGVKRLHGLTPYEFICKKWAAELEHFKANPHHRMPELQTLRAHTATAVSAL